MKRTPWHSLLLIAVLSFSVLSCELIPTKCGCGEPPPPPVGTLEANFSRDGWLSTSAQAIISNGRITIIAHNESSIRFSIEAASPGHYNTSVADIESKNVFFYTPQGANIDSISYSTAYAGLDWGVEIREINTEKKTITGRFDVRVENGKAGIWMDGEFNQIPYVEEPYNAFNGKVNDLNFESVITGAKVIRDKIDVNFFKANGETIHLSIPAQISPGTYDLGETYKAAFISAETRSYKAATGSITITEHNRQSRSISGTFSFEGDTVDPDDDNVAVTDAAFTVYY